jgi:16S rRNA (uracil1498-N3)-methyltransferase
MLARLFLPDCANNQPTTVRLSRDQSHYLSRVLRLSAGDRLIVFDGQGREASATVAAARGSATELMLGPFACIDRESPLAITVIQALCTGEKMDWVVQKATELGAAALWPVQTQRSLVRLYPGRAEKRREHWQRIAEAAAAQSGRNRVPLVAPVQGFAEAVRELGYNARLRASAWPDSVTLSPGPMTSSAMGEPIDTYPRATVCWLLDPGASALVSAAPLPANARLVIAIGPEAGFTGTEEALARQAGFVGVRCGPRVLRTETAAAAVLAAVATRLGEF